MTEAAIFIFYFLLCSFLISKIRFFKSCGLSYWALAGLFAIKIAAGIAFALFYKLPQYYQNADTWRFYHLSLTETDWLLQDPIAFVKDLFAYGYNRPGNLFSSSDSYWNDLKSNAIIKLMAVTNVITLRSYYATIVIFNFFYLFGLFGLYRVYTSSFSCQRWLIVAGVFLIPSTLFWCSGIHKDGFVLSATGVIVYCIHRLITKNGWRTKHVSAVVVSLVTVFVFRNYVVLAMVPAILCWYLSARYKAMGGKITVLIFLFCIAGFFAAPFISPSLNLPAYLANKQHDFLLLAGGSAVNVPVLQPTFAGYISFLPHALDMAFLRPHLLEIRGIAPALAFAEVVGICILVVAAVLFGRKTIAPPVFWFCMFFSVVLLLIAGFTITFSGAIVRYRSFALPFLVPPLLCIAVTNLPVSLRFLKSRHLR